MDHLAPKTGLWERIKWTHRAWRYRWKTEPHEISYLRQTLRPGDTAIDVGAHKGAFTFWMARRVGATGQVIAFEPNPRLAGVLARLAAWDRRRVVDVRAVALSDHEGTALLHFPGDHLGSASLVVCDDVLQPPVPVSLVRLDDHLRRFPPKSRIRLIKCDVEAHECAVLSGATATLCHHRPRLLVECGDPLQSPDRLYPVIDLMTSLGYRGYYFAGATGQRVPWQGASTDLAPLRSDQQQNFLFVHSHEDEALGGIDCV